MLDFFGAARAPGAPGNVCLIFLGQLAHLAHLGDRLHDFLSGLGGLGLGPRDQARAHDENPRPRLFGAARAPGILGERVHEFF